MKDYHINIFYSEQDQGYIADIPDLHACSAFRETPARALAEVLEAKASWLEAAKSNGKRIPLPEYLPVWDNDAENTAERSNLGCAN